MRLLCVVASLAGSVGCGRIGFAPVATDGSATDDAHDDAAELGPFGPASPANVTMPMAGQPDDDPFLSRGDRELYFASTRSGGAGSSDLYVVIRDAPVGPFSQPMRLAELCSATAEGYPVVSADGHELWFSRGSSVMTSKRLDRSMPWETPVAEPGIDGPGGVDKPGSTFDDDRQMIFESELAGDRDLYLAQRAARGQPWSLVRELDELSTPSADARPYVTDDGLEIYFYSNRPPSLSDDLWVATRPSITDRFGAATRIQELATAGSERDPTLSRDRRTLIFARGLELFIATR